jgi:ATP phosphoribosyltransferase regulatory subunit
LSSIDKTNNFTHIALLPAGFKDQLPSVAAHEAQLVQGIIERCESYGYERVKPPLIEFEDSLFHGPGKSMMESAFRLMDPVSGRMMGVRADMTVQVARIATTRLGHLARPLRLCYSGEVLRVTPDNLNSERELVQVGAELVGADVLAADLEVILMAFDSLNQAGVRNMSIDITAPALVPALLNSIGLDLLNLPELRDALDRKDISAVENFSGANSDLLINIMIAAGPWQGGIDKLRRLNLPLEVVEIIDRLEAVASTIASESLGLEVTIDPVENRGFEYYSGLGFSFFSKGIRGELGRGGRYNLNEKSSESSCGFTLYMETLLRASLEPIKKNKLFIPAGENRLVILGFQADGWSTVSGLESVNNESVEAKRLGCSHFLKDGMLQVS